MKCPYCGYEDEGLGTTCDNCWREIRKLPGTCEACGSCGQHMPAKSAFCPNCGAMRQASPGASEEVLSQEDFGPMWTGGPSDVSYKMYGDRVTVEQDFFLTGTRRVTTMRKPVFWAGNLFAVALTLLMAFVFMATGAAIGFGPLVLLGLLFMCLALYTLFVFVRMEAKAGQRREEDQ